MSTHRIFKSRIETIFCVHSLEEMLLLLYNNEEGKFADAIVGKAAADVDDNEDDGDVDDVDDVDDAGDSVG